MRICSFVPVPLARPMLARPAPTAQSRSVRRDARIRRMYVAGEWRTTGNEDEVRNPYSGDLVGTVPRASATDVEAALAAAVDGAAAMRRLSAHERQAVLERAAELTAAATEELTRTISGEVGKPITEARGEAGRIPDLIRLSAAEGARMHGETVPVDAAPNA